MSKLRIAAFVAATIAVAGCAPATSSSTDRAAVAENAGIGSFKQTYSGVVTGADVKGTTALVYVDVNGMNQMDEQSEIDMKSAMLTQWKSLWRKNHPGQHATLTLELHDFRGNLVYTKKTKA
ncbi:MAG: hypothetical protein M3R35_05820 [Candidatus Eremiobacteraeota bacterium]|nr:hypothetical protein [Candidatus Eremiobacteraeota bacterium]